ncbi:MAG: hypothetical protein LBQ54_13700, partial [Planctomycetaceae bacterium]|nr:hypothetical protein [Planctomycetaceae bacterium]
QAVDTVSLLRETWRNPYVEQGLTPQDQMLLTGAAVGAQRTAGSPYITPRDMARLTAGMGSGYAAGLVAGKVLGTLTGMPQEAQNALIKGGVYAGVIKSVLPMIYGF